MFNSDFPFQGRFTFTSSLMDRKEKLINSTKFAKNSAIIRIKLLKFISGNWKQIFQETIFLFSSCKYNHEGFQSNLWSAKVFSINLKHLFGGQLCWYIFYVVNEKNSWYIWQHFDMYIPNSTLRPLNRLRNTEHYHRSFWVFKLCCDSVFAQ